jgi:hypothetical protein
MVRKNRGKYAILILAILLLTPIAARVDDAHPTIVQIQASGSTADDKFIILQNSTSQNIDIGSKGITSNYPAHLSYIFA